MVDSHKKVRSSCSWCPKNHHDRTESGDTHRFHGVCAYYKTHKDAPLTIYAKIHNCASKRAQYRSTFNKRKTTTRKRNLTSGGQKYHYRMSSKGRIYYQKSGSGRKRR